MTFAVADRVKESTTSTGTGTINLSGTSAGFQGFVAGIGNGNTTYYAISSQTADEWEVGIGTVTDAATDTLSRDTIISSSNSDLAVNFSAGTKDVISTLPSSKAVIETATGVDVTGALTTTDEIHINSAASGNTLHTLLKLETDGTADGSGITIDTRTAHTRGEINFLDGTGSYDSNYVFKTATGSQLAAPTEKFRVSPTGATVTGDLTVDTDTLYVDSTNNLVGIGTTGITGFKLGIDAQGDGIGALKMYSNVAGRPTIDITNTNSTDYAQSVLWLQCNRTTTNGSYNFMRVIQAGVTDKFFIRDSGDVVNANNSYGAISDLKLKEQITDASSQSTDIKNIRIRKFKFKHEVAEGDSDSLWKLGVIAQEIEAVSPGLVETVKDTDKEGNAILDDEGNESYTKNVKYSVLYMKAVKALQEVLVEIDTLKARITTLENN